MDEGQLGIAEELKVEMIDCSINITVKRELIEDLKKHLFEGNIDHAKSIVNLILA